MTADAAKLVPHVISKTATRSNPSYQRDTRSRSLTCSPHPVMNTPNRRDWGFNRN